MEDAMTIRLTPRSTALTGRRRITSAGAVLVAAAGAIVVGALGAAAPANAACDPLNLSPDGINACILPSAPPPADAGGPYVAIAFSPDNGAHGWANNADTQQQAQDAALQNCRNFGGKQCGVDAWSHNQCAAIAVMTPAVTANHQWGAHHGTWGATIADANANASAANGGGEVMVARCATGDDGWG
jgi:hypothetical protein